MNEQKRINAWLRKDLERCTELYHRLYAEMETLEKGSVVERNGAFNWCFREGGKTFYRKIRDENLLIRLRRRQYIKRGLPILEKRIRNCRKFLENDVIYDPLKLEQSMGHQYQGLKDTAVFLDGDVNPHVWQNEDYLKGEMFENNLIYKMDEDTWMRSKSETMIAMRLKEKGFKARYEPHVKLKSGVVYPDFEILLENARRIVYYEHFGMMDNPEYALKALNKLTAYAADGISLGYNLVISYETKDEPLNLAKIDRVIEQLKEMDSV